ncbi:MAG: putative nucleotidyltransferase substrate binding domain-containing protein [Marmoricola sp.]
MGTDGLIDTLIGATSVEQLQAGARQARARLPHLLAMGAAPATVITWHTDLVDNVVRRALQLVFAQHPSLSLDLFTWLSLGSNGRRETVPSSDLDAAVAFDDRVSTVEVAQYRIVFGEVIALLADAGLRADTNGVNPSSSVFARTNGRWRSAGQQWLVAPLEHNAAMMTSLLVDARPIHGDPGLPAVTRVFGDLRAHPATMRLLLEESLSKRARTRTVRNLLHLDDSFDVKQHALLPLVNLARWAALSAGSFALPTVERLQASGGTSILPAARARTLVEVFEVLQGLRLRYQLAQMERGERPTDVLERAELSSADRSTITSAVHEIAAVQKRADNIALYAPSDEWTMPEDG